LAETHTRADRLLEIFNSLFLALIAIVLLVMEPAKLLQDLGMLRVPFEYTSIGILRTLELCLSKMVHSSEDQDSHLSVARGRDQSGTRYPPR
jgi:hypothetical protein